MRITAKKTALYGMMVAAALVLSYLESLIPPLVAVPGMKLGLSNLVILAALYILDSKSAVIINVIRIILVAVLFGNMFSLAYSFAGALLSTAGMILLKKTGKFRMVTVSIAGGVLHNIGQIIVAVFVLHTVSIAWYILILWFTGIISGAGVGIIASLIVKRLEAPVRRMLG